MSKKIKDDLEVFFPTPVKVKIAGQEFGITPFVLKDRTQVIRVMGEIFQDLTKTQNLGQLDKIAVVVKFVEVAGDRIIEIYEMVLRKDRTWLLNNMQLKDEINVISAIREVNDLPFLISQVSKMMGKNL